MPNLYRCQKCGYNFESDALYPSTYRVLCSDCESSRNSPVSINPGIQSVLAKEINPNWVYGFVGVTMICSIAMMGMLFLMQQPEARHRAADVRADQQRNEQFKSLAAASSVQQVPDWEKGSRVKIKFGFICKTSEEWKRVDQAISDSDMDVIEGLRILGRVKQIENKTAVIVRPGLFQTQVECGGFTGWIGTEHLTAE